MRICLLVEGSTEKAFLPYLRAHLLKKLAGNMPKLVPVSYKARIPKETRLKREVERLLGAPSRADAVVALTDVYTGSNDFVDAADAKRRMREWCSDKRFHPHAAQYEFEAWLLPYWERIKNLTGTNAQCPGSTPENVNHTRPPSYHIRDAFLSGRQGRRRAYVKTVDAKRILEGQDLEVAASACPELRAFLDTIIGLCTI